MFDARPQHNEYLRHRAQQFRSQVQRRLDGSLTEDEFRCFTDDADLESSLVARLDEVYDRDGNVVQPKVYGIEVDASDIEVVEDDDVSEAEWLAQSSPNGKEV